MDDFLDLDEFKSFKDKNKEKILKYIVSCYKKNKDQALLSLRQRKEAACRKAGMKISDKWVKDIMSLKNQKVAVLINLYISSQNDAIYETYIAHQQLFWDIQKSISQPIDDEDDIDVDRKLKAVETKGKLSDLSDKLIPRIASYRKLIYGDNDDVVEANIKTVRMTPESMAKKYVQ